MSLASQLSREFESAVRNRGRLYFIGGTVRVKQGNQWLVRATVRGTDNYAINLSRKKSVISASCTCPYYETQGPCKHLWATILTADAKNYLGGTGSNGALRLALEDDDPAEWDDEYDEDADDEEEPRLISSVPRAKAARVKQRAAQTPKKREPPPPSWRKRLASLRQAVQSEAKQHSSGWPSGREILYLVDVQATKTNGALIVDVNYRERKKNNEWSKLKSQRIPGSQIPQLPDPLDRRIMSLVVGAKEYYDYAGSYYYNNTYDSAPIRYRLTAPVQHALLPLMCETGRCRLRLSPDDEALPLISWDDDEPWEFWLEARRDESGEQYVIEGSLRRHEERMNLSEPALLIAGGLVFGYDRVARLDDSGAFFWISLLRQHGALSVPARQADELLAEILSLPQVPKLDFPEDLRFEEVTLTPRPRLKVKPPAQRYWGNKNLRGELSFDYEGEIIGDDHLSRGIFHADERRLLVRDALAEQRAAERLQQLGFRQQTYYNEPRATLELTPSKLPRVVGTLVEAGWHVEAEGKLYRQPGAINVEVRSGIDWFELHGTVEFGDGAAAKLPELLAALKRGENAVRLDDGTFGILPEEWLKKYGTLAGLGAASEDHLRFTKSQVGLLDALLAAQPAATCDALFERTRDELRRFEGVKASDPPDSFNGKLRAYQREGLGWLHFLRQFNFGGCLADDMGLGKTIEVLALLETRREERARNGSNGRDEKRSPPVSAKGKKSQRVNSDRVLKQVNPSLVVVPKSLVFNWQQEAARFTPHLRVLDHTGAGRVTPGEHFKDYDLVITTYGTLRRDAINFKDIEFDYVILDEAQAIKNASTESAKAARLLRGTNRLALSGTPVENHLGELWSLFEFLNPGMLGAASVLKLGGNNARLNLDEDTRDLLAHALRPFILRRTKEQVAKDLPPKLEQTLYCELETAQRKLYDELRDHYRASLLGRIEREGINRAKIQILEALLRLRQAACHPGLIAKNKISEPSAKLDLLLPQLAEVLDEGHKALVFSQFTSLLAIVRDRLDRDKISYEYLDGRTRDRAAKVERFQNDPECRLFLVSLKAGGLGLNLTAAEYVFLLDPWWNPAVEAQAIDRAHRIGQTRRVFAYRLIARDTVEEKVLELQQTKRALADAIINADNSLIRNLGREDLELLLS